MNIDDVISNLSKQLIFAYHSKKILKSIRKTLEELSEGNEEAYVHANHYMNQLTFHRFRDKEVRLLRKVLKIPKLIREEDKTSVIWKACFANGKTPYKINGIGLRFVDAGIPQGCKLETYEENVVEYVVAAHTETRTRIVCDQVEVAQEISNGT